MKLILSKFKYLAAAGTLVFGTIFSAAGITTAFADGHGKAAMKDKDVVGIAVGSKDHTTLVTAVKAAGLVPTLQGKGPFTVFAPTNSGFGKLPEGTVPSLLKKKNKGTLTSILTYHVIAGKFGAADVMALVKKGNGKATVNTVQGGKLVIMSDGAKGLKIMDENGGKASITATDLKGSNGVVHVIDSVLMPKS